MDWTNKTHVAVRNPCPCSLQNNFANSTGHASVHATRRNHKNDKYCCVLFHILEYYYYRGKATTLA